MPHDTAPEHEFEAQPGLPEPLPAGERLLWQGAPQWRVMAREALHLRTLSIYFAALLVWRGATVWFDGGSALQVVQALAWMTPLALLALAVLGSTAWLVSRSSLYTITDRRVVMRVGVVLSVTFNLPYTKITAAALRANADGTGDLTLELDDDAQIAYVHLWPHARPWRLRHTQPMLRAVPEAQRVAALLATALAQAAGGLRAQPVSAARHSGTSSHQQQPLAA